MSPDDAAVIDISAGIPNGLKLYMYCFNDPVNFTDSTGNTPLDEFISIWEKKIEAAKRELIATVNYIVDIPGKLVNTTVAFVDNIVFDIGIGFGTEFVLDLGLIGLNFGSHWDIIHLTASTEDIFVGRTAQIGFGISILMYSLGYYKGIRDSYISESYEESQGFESDISLGFSFYFYVGCNASISLKHKSFIEELVNIWG